MDTKIRLKRFKRYFYRYLPLFSWLIILGVLSFFAGRIAGQIMMPEPLVTTQVESYNLPSEPTPTPYRVGVLVSQLDKVNSFFQKYNCQLDAYVFVNASTIHGLDYRLLPAIAFRESTCGKHMLGNNPFGFGYYKFESVEEAANYVSAAISGDGTKDAKYYLEAKKRPMEILSVYNTVVPDYTRQVLLIMYEIGEP